MVFLDVRPDRFVVVYVFAGQLLRLLPSLQLVYLSVLQLEGLYC